MNINEANLKFGSLSNRKSTRRVVLHHAEASKCSPDDIHRWHKERGWSGAGYHFLVRKDGTVWRLRPEGAVGAHAQGANSDSIGICFEGNYMTETMGQAQIDAGSELVAHLKCKYGVSKVLRHKEVGSTDCPGINFPFDAIVSGSAMQTPPAAPSKPAEPSAPANTGASIKDVQKWLSTTYGYNLAIDGKFGPDSKRHAVMALQTEYNRQFGERLAVDGKPGPATKAAWSRHNIRRGAKGNITRIIQGLLIAKGIDPKGFDGSFGPGCEAAVRAFQVRNGLKDDGVVGSGTFSLLVF